MRVWGGGSVFGATSAIYDLPCRYNDHEMCEREHPMCIRARRATCSASISAYLVLGTEPWPALGT